MKFDFCIGNPPYQDNSDTTEWDLPVYDKFMDVAYSISDKVELVTPARFLFNAGKTPKSWNKKMLNDNHFKVLDYSIKSQNYFDNVDIKGGVAIHYHDINKNFGAIKTFTTYKELNAILRKVKNTKSVGLDTIMYSAESYRFTPKMHEDFPQIKYQEDSEGNNIGYLSKGHDFDIASNTFKNLVGMVFFKTIPNGENENDYMQIYGRTAEGRIYLWIKKIYIANDRNLNAYKVFIPAANGSGALGEVLSTPVIGEPVIGHNQTFISLGCFNTRDEAEHALAYIKTKFARTLIGTLKVTQNGKKGVYANVPLQDFTSNSDIDWNKSISDIDKQLYQKYDLSDDEIKFIETHVKEMN